MSVASGPEPPVVRRARTFLSHAVYGLILTLATVGELIRHGSDARESVAWVLGAGGVLLVAHLFSDVLAETAATQRDLSRADLLRVGREDFGVASGFLGAASIMAVAAIGDLNARTALVVCVVVGLLAVAALSFHATAHHRQLVRVAIALLSALLGVVIVVLENTV